VFRGFLLRRDRRMRPLWLRHLSNVARVRLDLHQDRLERRRQLRSERRRLHGLRQAAELSPDQEPGVHEVQRRQRMRRRDLRPIRHASTNLDDRSQRRRRDERPRRRPHLPARQRFHPGHRQHVLRQRVQRGVHGKPLGGDRRPEQRELHDTDRRSRIRFSCRTTRACSMPTAAWART
jgi:hypothetical protein